MEGNRRQLIEGLFEEALDLPPSERDGFLSDRCADDPTLAADVRRLLKAHERSGGLLEESLFAGHGSTAEPLSDSSGKRIGKYRILKEIGKGGMGRVYLAERADGHFKQRVALKVIPRSDPDLQARVVAERQILASLQHPNISRLLDGGVTEDGRAFLVMEFVDGLPIDVYCDRMRLSLRHRLRVFLTVLRAVEHAHQNLVVHRDLKPSNILVTPSGDVKLLDFGIAKILNPDLSGADTPITKLEHRALTPEFASPEQIRGETITTASDIYSLGVILYDLLSGHPPYRFADRSLPALVKTVCEVDPAPPSARVERPETVESPDGTHRRVTPERLAEARLTTSGRLRRSLKGDLDAIVMKALRKEPSRRYGSVDLLSQDIQRFLDGHPVDAHKGTTWYRVQKLMRRNRAAAVAAILATLSLVGGAGAAAWQAGVAARERDRTTQALRESEEVTDFLLGLFESSDPEETPGDTVTALDLLMRGERRADALVDEPLVRARMLQVIARAHQNLGQFPSASELSQEALELVEAERGEYHPETAEALVLVGLAQRNQGLYERAIRSFERALAIQESTLGPVAPEIGLTLEHLARADVYLGDLTLAEERARQSVEVMTQALGRNADETLNALSTVGAILRRQGRYSEAEEYLREVLQRRRAVERLDVQRLSTDMLALGDLIRTQRGAMVEAEALYREALGMVQESTGIGYPNLVWALGSLGALMEEKGDLAEAERLYRESVEVRRRTYGDLHPLVAETMGGYGLFLIRSGRPEEAEVVFRRAAELGRQTVGPDHPRFASTLSGLAHALSEQGKLAEADSVMSRTLEIRVAAHGWDAPLVAQTMAHLADIKTLRRRFSEAEALLNEAVKVVEDQPSLGGVPEAVHGAFARLFEALGRMEESERHKALAASGR